MRNPLRHAIRAVAVAAALTATVPLVTAPAQAQDVVPLAEDVAALGLDTVYDAAKGCTPYVQKWSPTALTPTPFIRNNSTWYRHTGGGTAHLTCPASVKVVTRLSDFSVPPFLPRYGPKRTVFVTSSRPTGSGWVEAPYVGPDAPVLRPYGEITVHVEVFRKLSTGRYAPMYFGCMEWTYIVQPAASLTVTHPTEQGFCKYDGAYVAADFVEGISQTDEAGEGHDTTSVDPIHLTTDG